MLGDSSASLSSPYRPFSLGAAVSARGLIDSLRHRAMQLKTETHALYLACRDPRTPWYAKAFAAFVVGYALSPLDLIPDFIPVIGHLDDLILVPLGAALALKMIPAHVMDECRQRANELATQEGPRSRFALVVIAIWLAAIALVALIVLR